MSTATDLVQANMDLDQWKISRSNANKHPHGGYRSEPWEERRAAMETLKKLKGRIGRLESKLISESGPIIHKDGLGQIIKTGCRVVWSDSGRYAGFRNIFYVSYNNPKMVAICRDKANIGVKNRATNVRPDVILVVDKILGP